MKEPYTDKESTSSLKTQIGGDHYKDFQIQPIEFILKNDLSFTQGNVIKRICRYNKKGGKGLEDLMKIKHEINLLIELGKDITGNDLLAAIGAACNEREKE